MVKKENIKTLSKRVANIENILYTYFCCCGCNNLKNGRLAQLGEHLPYKQGVTGSIPVTSIGRMV